MLTVHIPGLSAADKQKKAGLLIEAFSTQPWTAVENFPSQTLRAGLATLRAKLEPVADGDPAFDPPDGLDGP